MLKDRIHIESNGSLSLYDSTIPSDDILLPKVIDSGNDQVLRTLDDLEKRFQDFVTEVIAYVIIASNNVVVTIQYVI